MRNAYQYCNHKMTDTLLIGKGALTRYGKLTWGSAQARNLILCLLIAWGMTDIYGAFEFLCNYIANL